MCAVGGDGAQIRPVLVLRNHAHGWHLTLSNHFEMLPVEIIARTKTGKDSCHDNDICALGEKSDEILMILRESNALRASLKQCLYPRSTRKRCAWDTFLKLLGYSSLLSRMRARGSESEGKEEGRTLLSWSVRSETRYEKMSLVCHGGGHVRTLSCYSWTLMIT